MALQPVYFQKTKEVDYIINIFRSKGSIEKKHERFIKESQGFSIPLLRNVVLFMCHKLYDTIKQPCYYNRGFQLAISAIFLQMEDDISIETMVAPEGATCASRAIACNGPEISEKYFLSWIGILNPYAPFQQKLSIVGNIGDSDALVGMIMGLNKASYLIFKNIVLMENKADTSGNIQ